MAITDLRGGSGTGGRFRVGDRITVDFTLEKRDGSAWDVGEFPTGRTLVSGPTSNYQRVIAEQSDVAAEAVLQADGSYSYTYQAPIPAAYLAPLNDTDSFGAADGELTGQPLADGTYTLGLYFGWNYTVDGASRRDAGNATWDFVIGSGALEPREVVKLENCNQCHLELQAHGQLRRDLTLCLLCHTAGSEDRNVGSVAGGTPGASIDFKVMVHKLHSGRNLPSVLGVATNPDGTRDYAATAHPYQLVGYGNSIHDYSEVGFPIMPSAYVSYLFDSSGTTYLGTGGNGPMPRDTGYSSLTLAQKQLEDRMRSGIVACDKCHGDPDGAGPLTAPAQGGRYASAPTRAACGSCHDDIDWSRPYTANGQTMPANTSDATCTLCHAASGGVLAVANAHRHPYTNSAFNTGVNLEITAVGGGSGAGGKHQAGDPIEVTFAARNDAGTDLQVHQLTRFQMFASGPNLNPQWLMPNANTHDFSFRKSGSFTGNGTISTPAVGSGAVAQTIAVVFASATSFDVVGSVSATLEAQPIGAGSGSTAAVSYNGVTFTITQGSTGFANGDRWWFEAVPTAASYTLKLPRDIVFERLGLASGAEQTLAAGNAPVAWGREVVYERTALVGAAGTLSGATPAWSRYVLADAASNPGIAVGDRVVIDAGTAAEEYGQVARIETIHPASGADLGTSDRFYLTQPLRYAHASGGAIREVTLSTRRMGLDYTLDTSGATGIVLLNGRFTADNPVVMSYRTDARFGWYRAPGDSLQEVYTPGSFDSEDLEASWGDWTGLALVDGTYTVGAWAHTDFTVTPLGALTATGSASNLATDNTTYRMLAPPATLAFLYGAATAVETRGLIVSGETCNACHGEIAGHGNGRSGFDTCILCHASSGVEDAAQYAFNSWYIGPTPGVTVDFRTLLHKVHMGKELANASTYTVNGVFLGVPYPLRVDGVGFPAMPGGTANCTACHGAGNTAWMAPADRDHPDLTVASVRKWRAVCGSCHDSSDAQAHIDVQTSAGGQESCGVCHGTSKEWSVERMHRSY